MKSISCISPGTLALAMVPRPKIKAGEIRLQIKRIGICGTDYHIFEGKHPYLECPRVMGHELAGEVLETPNTSAFSPGETVIVNPYLACGQCGACRKGKPNCCTNIAVLGVHTDGGMCEEICIPQANVVSAQGLSLDACASVEFLAIGAHAVRRASVAAADKVLVVGAGPIGLGVALFAQIAGANVSLFDLDGARITQVSEILGDIQTIDSGKDVAKQIASLTDGEGFDAVFDATGNVNSMQKNFEWVAHGGRYTLVGIANENISFAHPEFHKREMTLLGSRNATIEDFSHVMAQMHAGIVPLDKIITHRTSIDNVTTNLPIWAKNKSGLIKAIIEVT